MITLIYPNKYFSLTLFLISFLWISGCHKKNLKKSDLVKNTVSKNIVQEVLNNNLQYETLRIKGKCTFKQDKNQTQFSYRLHIEKGKKVWASLSGFGIEAVRALIDGDSAAYFNRLQNTFWKGSVSDLAQKFGIQGDINIIQSIIIGNFFLNHVDKVQNQNQLTEFFTNFNSIPLYFSINSEQKIQKIEINDTQKGWKSLLSYENFQVLYNKLIPLKINVLVQEPYNIQANLEHKEIEVNPKDLKFNFEIPSDYKPVKL
jgi:hypothetical protein